MYCWSSIRDNFKVLGPGRHLRYRCGGLPIRPAPRQSRHVQAAAHSGATHTCAPRQHSSVQSSYVGMRAVLKTYHRESAGEGRLRHLLRKVTYKEPYPSPWSSRADEANDNATQPKILPANRGGGLAAVPALPTAIDAGAQLWRRHRRKDLHTSQLFWTHLDAKPTAERTWESADIYPDRFERKPPWKAPIDDVRIVFRMERVAHVLRELQPAAQSLCCLAYSATASTGATQPWAVRVSSSKA